MNDTLTGKGAAREVCINIVAIWVNFGIVFSSVFDVAAAKTFLPPSLSVLSC